MQKPYKAKSSITGPCGPCSFINLTGIRGSPKKEKELSKIGRFKPFGGTMYTGFLEWGEKYKIQIKAYTTSKKVNSKFFSYVFSKEKTPKNKRSSLKNKAIKNLEKQNKKFKDKIYLIKNPKQKLDSLLKKKHKVAVGIVVYNKRKKEFIPHWVVAYKKTEDKYHFLDSAKSLKGYRILSVRQLRTAFKKSKEMGFDPQMVIIEKSTQPAAAQH